MKPNIKKLLILNAPYLLFVYLFDKVGQAVRLSPGADLSGKLLSIGSGFSAAFSNALPSFAPMDLLIGIVGAVVIRLAVYVKGKNAKKYRKGMEYGSARWGNAEDIKPYIDPVFENNVLLTQTERLMMSSRPKHPKYARNKNVLVIGGGGIYYGSQNASAGGSQQLIVYNWGEYMDSDVIDIFEEETGIHVVYEEYETNEIMYPKIKSGAISYDLVCPSDYMIQKMIQNDLLQPINFDHIPNASNIGDMYYETSEQFDPGNLYSIPYCWGTVGILYNKKMVTEPIDSWSVLWDTNYRDSILMQDSVRDAFAVALKDLGYSLNSTNIKELTEAKDLLVTQKPLVQAYVVDQVRDKMIGNEAAIGVIYSGEAIYTKRENPDLEYVVPKEGSNVWIDSWCIPKDAQHVENAEKFLNFLCRPDIALKNFEYITYSTPNDAARELIEDDDIRNSEIAFPDEETLARCETFTYLGDDADETVGLEAAGQEVVDGDAGRRDLARQTGDEAGKPRAR